MDRAKFIEARQWVRDQLDNVADFWLKNGMDAEHGGIYTCLDRKGEIFSTDKSVWMQGRCGWTYAWVGRIPGGGNGNPLQYSCLGNPMDRGTWQAALHGVAKSRTLLK